MQQVRKREPIRGKLKSPRRPKFEEKPEKVWAKKIALQTCNQSALASYQLLMHTL